jgi:hypothetical protein
MDTFLETLKLRHTESQRRMQIAQQKLTAAQAEYQAASQEFGAWNFALATENHRAELAKTNGATWIEGNHAKQITNQPAEPPVEPPPIATKTDTNNKTELVRTFLQQHPTGVTPSDLWTALKSQLGYRAYVYSVLKRLKDKDEVHERRGKYYFKHRAEEERDPNTGIQ